MSVSRFYKRTQRRKLMEPACLRPLQSPLLLGQPGEAGVWQIASGQWASLLSGGLLGPTQ